VRVEFDDAEELVLPDLTEAMDPLEGVCLTTTETL